MPSIEIDHALADSQIEPLGFVARGTWTDNTPPAAIICRLIPSGPGANVAPAATLIDPLGFWRCNFNLLVAGQTFTLHAEFAGALPDDEPRIKVRSQNDPGLILDPLPPPPIPVPGNDDPQDYRVTGKYDPRDVGVGMVCLSVTRAGHKIRTVEAAVACEMKNGIWTATLKIKPVARGKKLNIVVLMLDGEGKVVARAAQKSPKQP
jgi:hypothetical protein